jgi:AcrR family transcriptional regulator
LIQRAEGEAHTLEPPTGRKIEQVIEAAKRLFLDRGFAATSMDAIAKRAAVSKATLYAYFPSKRILFGSLIETECQSMNQELPLLSLDKGLETVLRSFARQYVRLFLDRQDLAVHRIIVNESSQFPELCRLFYESGPRATIERLAGLLDEAKAKGLLDFKDSTVAATQFLSLIRGELPLLTMLCMNDADAKSIEADIDAGLKLFLKAYYPAKS